jgi:aspartyl-tRNA(Asn)/glutamyl-tRNA(Gln) amidotransferase subunit B
MAWIPTIGLEVHVQLATASKAFSSSAARFGAHPNAHIDPVVLGLPGALPVFNRRALELAVKLGIALGCKVRRRSRFARKQYFYPDLPKGYQISQYDEPLCDGGAVELAPLAGGEPRRIPLTRIHLEEDAGKSIHRGARSFVDLNRAGVPLVEIVSEPALDSAAEAGDFLRALRQLVRYLGISEGDMEKGQLRCDANVSIRAAGADPLGTRTELKNINSFRFVEAAIEHEIRRQIELVESGGAVVQETRLWDADAGRSRPMRSKEEAEDYRYFPDPDLPPLVLAESLIKSITFELPELPGPRRRRFGDDYGLSVADAALLTGELELADYFEAAVRAAGGPERAKPVANWITTELLREVSAEAGVGEHRIGPARLGELVALIEDGTISGKIGKQVFALMLESDEAPAAIVEREGLVQISDETALAQVIDEVVAAHPGQLAAYRAGKTKLLGFFVGQVMKATRGQANPAVLNRLLAERLAL